MLISKLTAQFAAIATVAAPSIVIVRSDDNPTHSNALGSQAAWDVRIDLPLPIECPPRVEESAMFLSRKDYVRSFTRWAR